MTCVHCNRTMGHRQARGLCRSCHQWLGRHGGLEDYPRIVDAHAEDIAELTAQGLTKGQIAERLGISTRTVQRHHARMQEVST